MGKNKKNYFCYNLGRQKVRGPDIVGLCEPNDQIRS